MQQKLYRGGEPLTLQVVADIAAHSVMQVGYATPHLFLQGANGVTVTMLGTDIPEHTGAKIAFFRTIGGICKREVGSAIGTLTDVFFTIEAWMVKIQKTPNMDMHQLNVVPSEHPERIEVVVVSHKSVLHNRLNIEMFEMKRAANGELLELVLIPREGSEIEGEDHLLDAFVEGWGIKPLYQ